MKSYYYTGPSYYYPIDEPPEYINPEEEEPFDEDRAYEEARDRAAGWID